MNTDKLMNEAKAAVNSRATALTMKLLQTVHAGGSARQVSEQIAQHIINNEWPATAALVVDMEQSSGARR